MKVVQGIVGVVAAVMLAALFVGAGFMTCLAGPVTHGLSTVFANDALSPYDRNQLVVVADATRDYSFFSHNELALYQSIYGIASDYSDAVGLAARTSTGSGFPRIDQVTDTSSLAQLKSAFAGASEQFVFSEDTVRHLDDCHNVASMAYSFLVAAAILAIAGLAFTGIVGRKRRVGIVLIAAGAITIAAFLGLGIWAIIDFNGFFAAFHGVFFSQGNWTFPYDSLLICALPTEFWMGMGAVCLIVAVVLSIISMLVGRKVSR